MFKNVVVLVVLAIIAVQNCESVNINISECSNKAPMPRSVSSNQCEADGSICNLPRGGIWRGLAEFSLGDSHNTMIVEITAFVFGISVNVDIPAGYEDACMFEQGHVGTNRCPIAAGRTFFWDIHSPIDANFPQQSNMPLESEFYPHPNDNEDFQKGTTVSLCARVPVNVR